MGSRSDVFCLSETWLNENSTTSNHLTVPSYSFLRRDRPCGRQGGGLLVYFSTAINVRRRTDLESLEIELLTFELPTTSPKHIVFFVYRPPSQRPEHFFHHLSNVLTTADTGSSLISVIGDMNAKRQHLCCVLRFPESL